MNMSLIILFFVKWDYKCRNRDDVIITLQVSYSERVMRCRVLGCVLLKNLHLLGGTLPLLPVDVRQSAGPWPL